MFLNLTIVYMKVYYSICYNYCSYYVYHTYFKLHSDMFKKHLREDLKKLVDKMSRVNFYLRQMVATLKIIKYDVYDI